MKLGIFAYHNGSPIVPKYVLLYLKELLKHCDRVIMSSDVEIPESELEKLKMDRLDVIHENHKEYDFGSYKRAMYHAIKGKSYLEHEWVILANDSCFCFGPLDNLMPKSKDQDYGGVVEVFCEDGSDDTFIPSYFMWFNRRTFDYLIRFLLEVKEERTKQAVCMKYERGINIVMKRMGFKAMPTYKTTVRGVKCYSHEHALWCNLVKKSPFTLYAENQHSLNRTKEMFQSIKRFFPVIDDYLRTQRIGYIQGIFGKGLK